MAQVSKKRLKKEMQEKVYKRFIKTVVKINTNSGGKIFLEELLAPTEFEMLAKRLAALMMLAQGISGYRVHKLLNMSATTTTRLKKELYNGKYTHITGIMKKRQEREKVWADIEVLVRLGMPEMGKNRWKWLNNI